MRYASLKRGVAATAGLLALYVVTMTWFSGWIAMREQFSALWWLMIPVAAGFGIQVGLYTQLQKLNQKHHQATVAASGTSAGFSMLACCAHHATDVAPFLGLTGLSLFTTRYQIPILAGSLLINIAGSIIMLRHIRKMHA